jgi:hypothetical protein
MGPVSIKMYDKFRLILRIETTVVNVSFFKHYREVEHKNGTRSMAWAEMKKTTYSLAPLRELLLAANRRYLEFISTTEDDKAGTDKLNKISQPLEEKDRSYRGFNFSIQRTRNCWKQRRVQHQRLPEQRPALARPGQKHGSSTPV